MFCCCVGWESFGFFFKKWLKRTEKSCMKLVVMERLIWSETFWRPTQISIGKMRLVVLKRSWFVWFLFPKVVFLVVIVLYWVTKYYDCGSYTFLFLFFFFFLGWKNSSVCCLPGGPCWCCDNVVREKSKCWSPKEGKWKKWYLWWFVWFLSLGLSFWLWLFCVEWWIMVVLILFFFFFLLGWSNSPINCLPGGPCWYCDDIVREKSKCWCQMEGKWKKWYLWWFVWFLSLELSFWLWLFFVLSDEWIMIAILILFFFFFFLLARSNSPIHCLPEGPCWYRDNVITEKSKCWSPKEGKWKKRYLW